MKRYKIVDIHPSDQWYRYRNEIIGQIADHVSLELSQYGNGWFQGHVWFQNDVPTKSHSNVRVFLGVKVEEVEE
jgi:hypothetical protein